MAKKPTTLRIDDTERCLAFGEWDHGFSEDYVSKNMLHANLLLSATNRRLYRQCRNYRLKIKLTDPLTASGNDSVHYRIYTLSNTWWVKRSIQMAKRVYMRASRDERKLIGSGAAKWNDFVIGTGSATPTTDRFLAFSHQWDHTEGGGVITSAKRVTDEGAFVSQLSDDDNDSWMFSIMDTVVGNTFNIFDEYLKVLNVSPTADVRDGPYQVLSDVDDAVMDDLQTDGDQPPWDRDELGDHWTHRATIGHDTNGYLLTSSGLMDCPLGLVWIEKIDGETGDDELFTLDNPELCAEFAKGSYKGVYAPSY